MARAKPNPAGIGHNNHRDLNDEEMGALVTSFTTKLIDVGRKEDAAAAELSGIRKQKSGLYKLISKECGFTRKEFEAEIIANLDRSEEELIADARRKLKLQQLAGLREGEQLDLIERINDTVDDAIAAEAAGYRAGRRADDPFPLPENVSPIFAPDYQRGWTRGQEVNAKAEAMAADILARPKAGEMTAGEDPDEAEEVDDDDLDPKSIQAQSRALAKSSWMEPRPDEQAFDGAEA